MSMPAAQWPEAEERIAHVARTRRGRHRDKALASYRRTRALELRAGGMSYQEIAHEVGYAHKGTAHKVIAEALRNREAESVDFLRALEESRLDALQAALWQDACAGNLAAVNAVVQIIDARCKLLGLVPGRRAKELKDSWPCCQGPATVVVRADDCRHAGCQRHGSFGSASPPSIAARADAS